MNKFSLEPKNGDFASLVDELGKRNLYQIAQDMQEAASEHARHSQANAINNKTTTEQPKAPRVTSTDEAREQVRRANDAQRKAATQNRTQNQRAQTTQTSTTATAQNTSKTAAAKKGNGCGLAIALFFIVSFLINMIGTDEAFEAFIPIICIFIIVFCVVLKKSKKAAR